MANWNGLQMTNKGIALQAKVEAGAALVITKLKLGSGVVPSGRDVKTLTDLIAPEQNLGIGAKEPNGDYCKISSTISNTGLAAGYYVRELGVFAQDPDDGEILYMYTTDGAPDYLPAAGGSTVISQEFSVNIAVSDTNDIKVEIDPGALATMGYVRLQIGEHNEADTAHKPAFDAHNASKTAHHDMTGATAATAGARGFVPAPAAGKQTSFLRGDGTWCDIASTEQAKAGTDDVHPMTSQKTKEAIAAQTEEPLKNKADLKDGKVPAEQLPEMSFIALLPVGWVSYKEFLLPQHVKANGATVNRSDYPSLVAYATEHNLWTDDPASEPYKYGRGDGSTTMVLPDYRNRVIQGGDTLGIKAPGLPNITGWFPADTRDYAAGNYGGVFSQTYLNNQINGENGNSRTYKYTLDASKASNVYGASNTVQPPAIVIVPQIKF